MSYGTGSGSSGWGMVSRRLSQEEMDAVLERERVQAQEPARALRGTVQPRRRLSRGRSEQGRGHGDGLAGWRRG